MANSFLLETIVDGPRNLIVKATGVLDTSNLAAVQAVIPATSMQLYTNKPPLVRLDHIDYSISDQLEVTLSWGTASNSPGVVLMPLAGRGRMSFEYFKGIPNNQSPTDGSIWVAANGWTSGIQVFTLIFECEKTGQIGVGVQ